MAFVETETRRGMEKLCKTSGRCTLCDDVGVYDEYWRCFLCEKHRAETIVTRREEARTVLLFSGGMDSLIAYFFIQLEYKRSVDACLFVDVRQRYRDVEIESCLAVKKQEKNFPLRFRKGPDLSISEEPSANIPLRNLYLVCEAVTCFSGVKEVYLVCQRGENYVPDRSPEFFELTTALLERLEKVRVVNPFVTMTKQDIVEWYIHNKLPRELLYATVGCYNPVLKAEKWEHCGSCSACFRRSVAFAYNGLSLDRMCSDIRKWEGIQKYIQDIKERRMEKRREKQTLEVLREWGYKI